VTGRYHKGETNPAAGVIVLSYSNLKSGFERRDGINLLMHELAHALWLENKLFEYEIFDAGAFSTYQRVAQEEFSRMQISENHFLRKYASTNEEEFFAVAVENFFERPQQFNDELPDLYRAMVALLKQDTFKLQLQ
jgi:hypothetical protein